jgi:glycerol-3-phosphate dehydrogenase
VVPRISEGEHAYILQNDDRRIVFAIPYERDFSLIGTTDLPFTGDPGQVHITSDEIAYLCDAVNRYFTAAVKPEHVIWSYAGVRPLYDDASENVSAVTRDYVFDLDVGGDPDNEQAPLLSIFGGKITTYRKLAEHALDKLQPLLGTKAPPWTESASLPGGDIAHADFAAFLRTFQDAHSWLPEALARRYARAYGTNTERLLGAARSLADLGEHIGGDLYEAEVAYLCREEWAETAEDILWRRSKLGLHLDDAAKTRLAGWLAGGHCAERKAAQ